LAGSAFTSLVNAFFVALVALIPDTDIGYAAVIVAVSSTIATLRLDRHLPGRRARFSRLVFSLVTFLAELVVGILILVHPHERGLIDDLCYVLPALFAVALNRAWELLQGKHTKGPAAEPLKA
jgi:hypothetical protein